MGLSDTEMDIVVDVVASRYLTSETLRAWLIAYFDVATIPVAGTPRADALRLLMTIDRDRPTQMLRVLRFLHDEPDIPLIEARYAAARAQEQTATPWQDRVLWGRHAFLDRRPLRDQLRRFVSEERPSAVLIRGPTKAGKSYTAELVRHVATQRRDGFAHVANAVRDGHVGLVESLLTQIEGVAHPIESVSTPDSHWHNRHCSLVLAAVARSPKGRWWIVIDRLGPAGSPVAEFCDYLLEAVASHATRARLVLLDYPQDSVPDSVPELGVEWERLAYGHIAQSDVRDYLQWLYRDVLKKPLTQEALEAETSLAWGTGDTTKPEFLRALRDALSKHVASVYLELSSQGVPT